MVKLYKFKTNFPHCMKQKELFGNEKSEYEKHFHQWVDWCVSYCGNANVKSVGNNHSISFKYGNERFKAEWFEY
jgi:hypothetical protein